MNRISKVDIIEFLEKKIKIENEEETALIELVEELYDLDREIVIPLDEIETFIFRKRYGILDNGVPQKIDSISTQKKIGYQKTSNMLESVMVKFAFRIKKMGKQMKKEKMSSLDLDDRREFLFNKSITSFSLSTICKNKLMKSFIFTIGDLMEWSLMELGLIFGKKELQELINCIHSLDIRFLDELSKEEKSEIIKNAPESKILSSSPYWIDGIEKIKYEILKTMGIEDIKGLVQNVFSIPKEERLRVMQFLVENDLTGLEKKEVNTK